MSAAPLWTVEAMAKAMGAKPQGALPQACRAFDRHPHH